ncbi:MAG: hypothetical protein JSW23_04490 [Planctomycetota bacterium]|nr:MAG: hypothetical protein JSW23_04490 [Planctomycetota bacterium]
MQKGKCSHLWEMINVTSGLIVMKKCFHCGKVSSCFTFHDKPPLEPCHEERHFWNFMESDPSLHFDLKCGKCGKLVKLGEMVGLMICTGCDETCEVGVLKQEFEPEGACVCIVCGCRPIDERKQLPKEKFGALEEYFEQRCRALKSKVKIVPHEMVRNLDRCYAEVVKDMETLFGVASKTK